MELFLGVDFGTSGARAIAIDVSGEIRACSRSCYPVPAAENVAFDWQATLWELLNQLPLECRQCVQAISIDGTSSTTVLCDVTGQPVLPPLMYNDSRARDFVSFLTSHAPAGHIALGATSGLAKLCWLLSQVKGLESGRGLSQADWLGFLLHGQLGVSDYNNCLKMGYDVEQLDWPDWFRDLTIDGRTIDGFLPNVVAPGDSVAIVRPDIAECYGFPEHCKVKAGTTDSIAAFLASQAHQVGQAVTSLGSSLAIKLLSDERIDDRTHGIYSHRLGDRWLVGGASNSGGAVLKHFFSDEQLRALSDRINLADACSLDYYPLLVAGERFPINDPDYVPRLTPRPSDDAEFLYGMLEGMAKIEARGYDLLHRLGAPKVTSVETAGGGAMNQTWTEIRIRHLGVPVSPSIQTEAAYGSALLARDGLG